jgi:hypothetical protein
MRQPRLMIAMTKSHIFYGDFLPNSPFQDLSGPLEVYELYVCSRQPSIDRTTCQIIKSQNFLSL